MFRILLVLDRHPQAGRMAAAQSWEVSEPGEPLGSGTESYYGNTVYFCSFYCDLYSLLIIFHHRFLKNEDHIQI